MLRTYEFTAEELEAAVRHVYDDMLHDPDDPEEIHDPLNPSEIDQAIQSAVEAVNLLVEKASNCSVLLSLICDIDGALTGYEFIYSFGMGAKIATHYFEWRDLVPAAGGLPGIVELAQTVVAEVNGAVRRLEQAISTSDAAWQS